MKKLIERVAGMQRILTDRKGATMVEYALMVALIAVVCVAAVGGIGTAVQGQFNAITAAL